MSWIAAWVELILPLWSQLWNAFRCLKQSQANHLSNDSSSSNLNVKTCPTIPCSSRSGSVSILMVTRKDPMAYTFSREYWSFVGALKIDHFKLGGVLSGRICRICKGFSRKALGCRMAWGGIWQAHVSSGDVPSCIRQLRCYYGSFAHTTQYIRLRILNDEIFLYIYVCTCRERTSM